MTLSNWLFHAPTKIVFGPGSVAAVGDEARALGATRVFIVTDRGVVRAGVLDRVQDALRKGGLESVVFDEVEANPGVAMVEKSHRLFAESGCDLLIGVGGGSSMDAAKATAILATNPGPILQYEGSNRYPNPPLPSMGVPTTAGTGAEVTQSAVITDRARNYKFSVRGSSNICRVAVLDPQLLTSLPPAVIASTGMDALSHAIESYLSLGASPLTEALALEAIGVISRRLRDFVRQPSDERAAAEMQYASMVAGLAFGNSRVTAVHAIAHTLGGHFNVAHGVACAIMLPPVMHFCVPEAPAKLARIASTMGEDVSGLAAERAAMRAVEAVERLARDIGVPLRLGEVGVTADRIGVLAADAEASGIHLTTPRKPSREDMEAMMVSVL